MKVRENQADKNEERNVSSSQKQYLEEEQLKSLKKEMRNTK
jgi:hypothetical protein